MKKFIYILISFLIVNYTFANFTETIYSADSLKLGNSVAKDYSCDVVFTNPAILKDVKAPEILMAYSALYPNLTDNTKFVNNTAAVVQNLFNIGVGVGFNQFGIADWYLRNKFIFSSGFNFGRFLSNLNLGLKVNYEQETFNLDDYMKQNPTFIRTNKNSYLYLSFGGIYKTGEYNKIGFTFENINILKNGFSEDINPVAVNFSYKYQYKKLTVYPSLNIEFEKQIDYIATTAFEYNFLFFKNSLKFSPSFVTSYGTRGYDKFIFGFDIQTKQIKLSYGIFFSISNKVNTGLNQCVSLSYKFLPQLLEEEKISKVEYEKLLKEKQQLEDELQQIKTTKQLEQPTQTQKETPPAEVQPQPVSTEELLLKKIQELERKLKEVKPVEEKPIVQPTTKPQETKPQETKKKYHTVVAGDTLPKIAEKYYGDSSQWRKIYDANRDKIIRGQLIPGSVLEIP